MIYYTKCRLINELNELNPLNSIFRFEKFESQRATSLFFRLLAWAKQLLLKKKKKEKFPPEFSFPFLFAFLIVVK